MDISELAGKTFIRIDGGKDCEQLVLHVSDSEVYEIQHDQQCCEAVWLEDVRGDLDDLIGSPIVLAEESSSEPIEPGDEWTPSYHTHEYARWTFYRLATAKGTVTLRWLGESTEQYSVDVSVCRRSNYDCAWQAGADGHPMPDGGDPVAYQRGHEEYCRRNSILVNFKQLPDRPDVGKMPTFCVANNVMTGNLPSL